MFFTAAYVSLPIYLFLPALRPIKVLLRRPNPVKRPAPNPVPTGGFHDPSPPLFQGYAGSITGHTGVKSRVLSQSAPRPSADPLMRAAH